VIRMRGGVSLFVSTLIGVAALGGLASAQNAAQRPQPAPPEPTIENAIPDENGVRRLAILRGLDKITGRAIDFPAPAGIPVRFGTLRVAVQYCYTTPPEEPPETSAFIQIDELGFATSPDVEPERIFSGWMFASSPALNGLEHSIYDVWAITCRTDEPQPEPPPAPAEAAPASEAPEEVIETPPAFPEPALPDPALPNP